MNVERIRRELARLAEGGLEAVEIPADVRAKLQE